MRYEYRKRACVVTASFWIERNYLRYRHGYGISHCTRTGSRCLRGRCSRCLRGTTAVQEIHGHFFTSLQAPGTPFIGVGTGLDLRVSRNGRLPRVEGSLFRIIPIQGVGREILSPDRAAIYKELDALDSILLVTVAGAA
jgi:hypothetical protein